jgi:uncharacterized protein YodC (DUF2158 family)
MLKGRDMAEPVKKALEVGDVVTLNSGGSPMTVTRLVPDTTLPPTGHSGQHVGCSWEGKDGVIHVADFPAAALKVTAEVNPAKPVTPATPPAVSPK